MAKAQNTSKFTIRRDTEADIPEIAKIFAHEDVFPILGTAPFYTAAQITALFSSRGRDDLGLCCYKGDELAGYAQIFRSHPAARRAHAYTMMVAVMPKFQRKGVATALVKEMMDYADKWVPCARIEIVVEASNKPAIELYKKFGFEKEGMHKNYVLTDGKYRDVIAMARVK